jgi:hypothetical protein
MPPILWKSNFNPFDVIKAGGDTYRYSKMLLCAFILSMLCSCEAQPQYELFNVLLGKDHLGPVLLKTESIGDKKAVYHFDEMVFCSTDDFSVESPDNTIISVKPYKQSITLEFTKRLLPGQRINVHGKVADRVGNTLTFTAGVWGHNSRLPQLLINEFSSKGSDSNPDRIELLALSSGNLAGVAIYIGMADYYDNEYVFPSIELAKGDRLTLVYGHPADDTNPLEFSTGAEGIGSNNGVISLYASPDGKLLDAVIYSNRTSDSDEHYGGFGTAKVQRWAIALQESGQWSPIPIVPEVAIDSTYSTATRSYCRTEGDEDTDSKSDWHIVPTRGASFGEPNLETEYEP